MTAVGQRRHSQEGQLGERPNSVVAEPGISILCSFPEMSTWDGAEGREKTKGSHGRERRGSFPSTTHPPLRALQASQVPVDSGSFILIVMASKLNCSGC